MRTLFQSVNPLPVRRLAPSSYHRVLTSPFADPQHPNPSPSRLPPIPSYQPPQPPLQHLPSPPFLRQQGRRPQGFYPPPPGSSQHLATELKGFQSRPPLPFHPSLTVTTNYSHENFRAFSPSSNSHPPPGWSQPPPPRGFHAPLPFHPPPSSSANFLLSDFNPLEPPSPPSISLLAPPYPLARHAAPLRSSHSLLRPHPLPPPQVRLSSHCRPGAGSPSPCKGVRRGPGEGGAVPRVLEESDGGE